MYNDQFTEKPKNNFLGFCDLLALKAQVESL